MWGELEQEERMQQPLPYVPLWHDGWRPMSVSCQVPRILTSHKLGSTGSDPKTFPLLLDYPRDSHDSNVLLHCIELQQYIEEMQQMITSSIDTSNSLRDRETLMAPVPPTKYWNRKDRKTWEKAPVCNPDWQMVSSTGNGCLDNKSCNLLQRKSVAAVSLLVGYEAATDQSLDVVSDVLGSFLERFSTVLKKNLENEQRMCKEGVDPSMDLVLERTLHQFGTGGKRDLKQYWQSLGTRHSQLMEDASEQVDEWRKTIGGGDDVVRDRDELLKSMKLRLNGGDSKRLQSRLASPWVANTPVLMGEEEMSITGDINLENVIQLKTPDIHTANTPEFSHLANPNDIELSLEFEHQAPSSAGPSRKRSRSSSFAHET